jgi:hypothetical protein
MNIKKEDLTYEELHVCKEISLNSSHWQVIYRLIKLKLKNDLTYDKRIYC